jgi:putative membrane protein
MPGLKPEDFQSVREAVRKFEKSTRGELVPLVIADAGEYAAVRFQAGFFGFILAYFAGEIWSHFQGWPLSTHEVSLLLLTGAALGVLIGSVPGAARWIIGRKQVAKIAHRRALAEFTRLGCGNTHERIGVLIMVALFERRIEIIADGGIQEVVLEKEGPDVWNGVTSNFSRAAGQGRAVEGLVTAIEAIGAILARHFPSTGPRENELSDELRTENDDD